MLRDLRWRAAARRGHHGVRSGSAPPSRVNPARTMQRRVLIYSGRAEPEAAARALALATAVLRREPRATCLLLARGVAPVADPPDGLTVVELPALVTAEGQPGGAQAARAGLRLLTDLALSFMPDVVVVDRDPLGALGELAIALAALSAMEPPPRTWLALDDLDLIRLGRRPHALRALQRTAGRYGALLVFGEADGCQPFVATVLDAGRVPSVAYAGYGRFSAGAAPAWAAHEIDGRRVVVAPPELGPDAPVWRERLEEAVADAGLVVTAPDHPALEMALAHGRALLLLTDAAAGRTEPPTEHQLRARTLERRGRARVLAADRLGLAALRRMTAVAFAVPPSLEPPATADRAAGLLLNAV
jgi:hypothetical protein